MPGYKAHLTGGIVFGGGLLATAVWMKAFQPDLKQTVALLSICTLGALFPDTDTDSKGQRFFYTGLVILDLALMIQGLYRWAAVLGFCAMLPAVGQHRGWTHTWWAMLLIPLPLIILPVVFYRIAPQAVLPFYLAAEAGYFSHLIMDRKF